MKTPDFSAFLADTPSTAPIKAAFIAHDYCGWNEQHGRFTACPNGETLVCQPWMRQRDWDKAQVEFFKRFDPKVIVHKCPSGPYRETGKTFGTVAEIIARIERP